MQDRSFKELESSMLPFRFNKKLLFCLCRTCVIEQNMRAECKHFSDDERVITNTLFSDEIRLAVKKVTGY